MTAFTVASEQLRARARRIERAVEEADRLAREAPALGALVAAAGSAELTGALHAFLAAWSSAAGALADDARRVADLLLVTATCYEDVEVVVAAALAGRDDRR